MMGVISQSDSNTKRSTPIYDNVLTSGETESYSDWEVPAFLESFKRAIKFSGLCSEQRIRNIVMMLRHFTGLNLGKFLPPFIFIR